MQQVRTFRASTVPEALRIIRRELGEDAVILNTRSITHRRLLPWLKAKQEVEVTVRAGQPARGTRGRTTVHSNAAPDGSASEGREFSKRADTLDSAKSRPDDDDSRILAPQQLAEQLERELLDRRSLAPNDSGVELSPSLERLIANPRSTSDNTNRNPSLNPTENRRSLSNSPGSVELTERLDSIQRMLESLNKARHLGDDSEVPSELFQLYTELLDADVEEDVARDMIFRLRRHVRPEQLHEHEICKSLLTGLVEPDFRIASPIKATPGRRRVVAVVGPTGVGKTTTIAKLAANFRLRDRIKLGLVTVDTYRVAAVEQLRTYAEIIDLPMKVVTSPQEMRRALDELVGLDLVLIDTGGRSPRDELKIQELKNLLAEAQVDEVHLVLSLTASLNSLRATVEKFSTENTTALILTKLDEAAGMGSLLTAALKLPLPVSYLTTGQDVPGDIEAANASRMARLVLGQERLNS